MTVSVQPLHDAKTRGAHEKNPAFARRDRASGSETPSHLRKAYREDPSSRKRRLLAGRLLQIKKESLQAGLLKGIESDLVILFGQLREVAALFEAEDRLSASARCHDSIPFDRLLLDISDVYGYSRKLGDELGVGFEPSLLSVLRAMSAFQPLSTAIPFSPHAKELKWWVSGERKPSLRQTERLIQAGARFEWAKELSGVVFHDLNHAILFRLVRPLEEELGRAHFPSELRVAYFLIIETLVILRDADLALELGRTALPLQRLHVLYRSCTGPANAPSPLRDPEVFRKLAQNTLRDVSGRRRLKPGADEGDGLWSTNHGFGNFTVPEWIKRQSKEFGSTLPLPPPARGHRLACRLPLRPVAKMLDDHAYWRQLQEIYLRVFWPEEARR